MAKKSNVTVKARQGESVERMIKRFMKLTKKFKVVEQVREKDTFKNLPTRSDFTSKKLHAISQKTMPRRRQKKNTSKREHPLGAFSFWI